MKKIFACSLLLLSGCSTLMNPQEQPVIERNIKEKIYFTTCSGLAEGWGSCFNKAKRTCPSGYGEIKRNQDSSGVHREFTFQCN